MNLTPANTGNRRPQIRMRGSLTPGSTGYDHMIIRPTQPVQTQAQTLPQPTAYNNMPVQAQDQTLPPAQPTAYYNNIDDEIQAFWLNKRKLDSVHFPWLKVLGRRGHSGQCLLRHGDYLMALDMHHNGL
ncbi:hypothetical protein Bca52824_013533 [Brassica carinata]|uniref:Uncharacterized protein n=1 Tax=Brassica carinata TaxID=52824 RepID=A0A8X8B2J8_BRACI|nr:hypothetical protein Bca52824_013533 [Brassica carinata]